MEKPTYKKITGDDTFSKATPVTDKQLEEAIRDKVPVEDILVTKEDLSEISNVIRQEIRPEARSVPKPVQEPEPVAKRPTRRHITELRRRDRYFNKTCAACGERKLLKNMDGGKADICDDCK